MSSTVGTSVAEALRSVAAEGHPAAFERTQQMTRLDDELTALKRAQTNIGAQISVLESHREEVAKQKTAVEETVTHQGQRVVFSALLGQQQALEERARAVTEVQQDRERQLFRGLETSTFAAEFQEYRQFKDEIEPTLSTLPASYRSVVLRHHQEVLRRLKEQIESHLSVPVEIQEDRLVLDIVLSVDVFDENELALTVVLPVSGALAKHWETHPDSIESAFAYRVVQGIYAAISGTSMQTRQLVVGSHDGLLILEMDLSYPESAENFSVYLKGQIESVLDGAGELRGAHVAGLVYALDADVLFPESAELDQEEAPTERAVSGVDYYAG